MGSSIEINDTLLLTTAQGFPALLSLDKHLVKPATIADIGDTLFSFTGKAGARLFHLAPVRVFLVQNIAGKWLFWGKAAVISQTIALTASPDEQAPYEWETSGTFRVTEVYEPAYQRLATLRESAPGKSYFNQ